jgi:hypothetical protein
MKKAILAALTALLAVSSAQAELGDTLAISTWAMGQATRTNPELNTYAWENRRTGDQRYVIVELFNDEEICIWVAYIKPEGAFTAQENTYIDIVNGIDSTQRHNAGPRDAADIPTIRNSMMSISKDMSYTIITGEINSFGGWKAMRALMTAEGLARSMYKTAPKSQ